MWRISGEFWVHAGFDFVSGEDLIFLGPGVFDALDTNDDGKLNNLDDNVTKNGNVTTLDVGNQIFGTPGTNEVTVIASNNMALNTADFGQLFI